MANQRLSWLSILRGLNILLVVMFHVKLIDLSTGENNTFCEDICIPFNPVRMPLFIFVSGGLLYLSRINKNVSTKNLYYDKFQRIMIPYFFFVIVYFLIKLIFNQFTKTKIELSLSYFLESFIYFNNHPSAPLWFLAVLMMFMLLYPLYFYLCKHSYLMVLFLLLAAAFYFVDFNIDERWNIFYILNVHHYFIYFFFGIFVFKFQIYRYLNDIKILFLLIPLYTILYYFQIPLLTSLIGILMMCSLCFQLEKYMPYLFNSFREYIFQIYLLSLPFQAFVELILWKHLFYNSNYFLVFYVLNVFLGIMMPVLISKIVNRCPIKIVRLCFGLK